MSAAERLARLFHETYERFAPDHGYETREASAVPWEQVPERNRTLMIDVASRVLRSGYVRTWVDGIDDDEQFPAPTDVTLTDPEGHFWTYDEAAQGWVPSDDPSDVHEWSAALMEARSLREVIA